MTSSRSIAPSFVASSKPSLSRHRLIEVLTVVVVILAVASLAVPAWLLFAYNPDREHPVNRLVEACQQGARRGSLAFLGFAAASVVVVWAGVFLARLLWRTCRDIRSIRRLCRRLAAAPLTGVVVADRPDVVGLLAERLAFTAGLLRPRVYLGSELIRALDPAETEAVLLHEMQHRRLRDPLRCWLVEVVLGSVSWRPARKLSAYYRASREADADAAAVAAQGDDRPLLRALAKADATAPAVGTCGLTSDRAAAVRQLRYYDLGSARSAWWGTGLGLGVLLMLLVVAAAGLMDWQLYWFCPGGSPMS